jgi:hypothetical protein
MHGARMPPNMNGAVSYRRCLRGLTSTEALHCLASSHD